MDIEARQVIPIIAKVWARPLRFLETNMMVKHTITARGDGFARISGKRTHRH